MRWNIDELRQKYAEGRCDFESVAFAPDDVINKAKEAITNAREAVNPFLKGELWEAVRDISLNILFGEDPDWLNEYPQERVELIAIGIVRTVEALLTTKEFAKSERK